MTGISIAGIIVTAWFVPLKIVILFFPLALVTFAYSIPLLKVKDKKKRLREIFLIKITTVALVWSFATVTFPLVESVRIY